LEEYHNDWGTSIGSTGGEVRKDEEATSDARPLLLDSDDWAAEHPRCRNEQLEWAKESEFVRPSLGTQESEESEEETVSYPYSQVCVLMLFWEDCDLGAEDELNALQDTFVSDLSFQTEIFAIPSHRPYQSLEKRPFDFRQSHPGRDQLFIVYYPGHGGIDNNLRARWWTQQ
jgi:hypothetical protein